MANPSHRISVSATEIPHFRRLVDFVTEVSVHADATDDDELREIVRQCRIDLLTLATHGATPEEFDA